MAKACLGKVSEFNSEIESFENYTERLEQFFKANDIKDTDKVSVFISLIGPELYNTLKSLIVPDLPKNKTYDDLIAVLKKHFVPTKNVAYERFLFNKRNQKEGESISEYAVQL